MTSLLLDTTGKRLKCDHDPYCAQRAKYHCKNCQGRYFCEEHRGENCCVVLL